MSSVASSSDWVRPLFVSSLVADADFNLTPYDLYARNIFASGNLTISNTVIINNTGDGYFGGNLTVDGLIFGTINNSAWNRSGTDVFLANIGDNVGIGSLIPTQKLHVDGNLNITEKSYFGGNATFNDYITLNDYNSSVGQSNLHLMSWAKPIMMFTEFSNGVTYGFGTQGGRLTFTSFDSLHGGVDSQLLRMSTAGTDFNNQKNDYDFRWSGTNNLHIFELDAGTEELNWSGNNFNIASGNLIVTNYHDGIFRIEGSGSTQTINTESLFKIIRPAVATYQQVFDIKVGGVATGIAPKTRVDFNLKSLSANDEIADVNVMTLLYNGNVGIGTPNPTHTLNVVGDVNITGDLINEGNITSANVFIPQYIFSHTNETIAINGLNEWTNITFQQEDSDIKQGIVHTYDDATNHTFMVMEDGVYEVDYDLDIEDTSGGASDVDVAGRLVYINGTEVIGSVFETDITKNGAGAELSHDFLIEVNAGDEFIVQFTGSDADVVISTHGTFGDYPESATIVIKKIANLP